MRADIDIQVVCNQNKGMVQLFIGDFALGLPPALCEQLEKDLAAARRIPERARVMADSIPGTDKDCVVALDSITRYNFPRWSPDTARDVVLREQYLG